MSTTTTSVDEVLSAMIRDLAVLTDEDLIVVTKILERAYTHVLVERGLRR